MLIESFGIAKKEEKPYTMATLSVMKNSHPVCYTAGKNMWETTKRKKQVRMNRKYKEIEWIRQFQRATGSGKEQNTRDNQHVINVGYSEEEFQIQLIQPFKVNE